MCFVKGRGRGEAEGIRRRCGGVLRNNFATGGLPPSVSFWGCPMCRGLKLPIRRDCRGDTGAVDVYRRIIRIKYLMMEELTADGMRVL